MKSTENKIAILGSGNIGMALAKGLVKAKYCKASQITLTRRNLRHLTELTEQGYQVTDQNISAVKEASVIILAVLPQQFNQLLQQIKKAIDPKKHLIISVVSGVSCQDIANQLGDQIPIIRAMPNTAISIGQSMTCFASDNASPKHIKIVTELFETVGSVMKINEELMISATALCACGIAFFLRAIRAASQGGIEIGFHASEALHMAAQTAKGAADLLLQLHNHPEHEIDKVTSPNGCTIAGLNEMEHHGFSSSLIKGIKLSATRAGGLYVKE
ncbi:MAG: pyrroline-5-carboxylate reductase [Pedobacter sp.]|nr:MAG: pyrroline-5-carboxylate reductase [Pedobacter sp.]